MSPSIEGIRVFNYKSQSWFWPIGDDEEIQFGVKDLLIDRWIYKIEIRWCSLRLALILAANSFLDITEYEKTIPESEIRREIREYEEKLEQLKEKLAGGYYNRP